MKEFGARVNLCDTHSGGPREFLGRPAGNHLLMNPIGIEQLTVE